MKPEKLIICGWGPYKEETVIDFGKLNTSGLFLITGQTGAGKTTIFDAIAYALYGVLSGEVREKGSVRSDFAGADTKTYVELYMSHKGKQYHISRNPEYLRPKKRKSGENAFTKEKENAVLTLPDGTIIAGNQDVTSKMEELLHMDGKQFRQISMIAQGEFSRMLFASPNEKNAIFRDLFGTGIYAGVQAELKRRSADLYREYMVYKNKMEEDIHLLPLKDEQWIALTTPESPDFEAVEVYLLGKLEEEKKIWSEQIKTEQRLEEELLALQKEIEATGQWNGRFREMEITGKKLEELQALHEQMEKLHLQNQVAKKAHVIYMEEKLVEEKERGVQGLALRMEQLQNEVLELAKEADELKKTADIKCQIQEAYSLQEQLKTARDIKQQCMTKQLQMQEKLQNAREIYNKAQEIAEEKKRQYEQGDVRYKKAVIGIAAKMIKEGEPCPVCGSIEHPCVAHVSEDIPDEKQLEAWKKEADESLEWANHCYEKALYYVNEEKQLVEQGEKYANQITELSSGLLGYSEDIISYVNHNTREVFEKTIERYVTGSTRITEKEKQVLQTKEEFLQKQKEAKTLRDRLEESIVLNGFADRKQYEQAICASANLEEEERKYRKYQEELVATGKLFEHLQKSLEGISPKEEEPLRNAFAQKKNEKMECRRQVEEHNIRVNQMTRSLQGIQKNFIRAKEIKREYGIVKDLDDLANGNNARRLVFEQFVLAGYFEKILQAANIRLTEMTDGRYELQRARQVSDGRRKDNLEMLVMDYYTGRKRSVKTLSGGETFKASLALALGMSDCIQAENGGIEVETLFIDEGFGALDEESLEQACSTLQMLAGKNRMVGIISHVALLREQIDHQIVVEKTNNGSYAKIF